MKKLFLSIFFAACCTLLFAQSLTPVGSPFNVGDSLAFNFTGAPGNATDWVGIYSEGVTPTTSGDPASTFWRYTDGSVSGTVKLQGTLPPGNYMAHLFCCDVWDVVASTPFSVAGVLPSEISVSRFAIFGDSVKFTYSGGTGHPKDWIGIYAPGAVPGIDLSLMYKYAPAAEGEMAFEIGDTLAPGDYEAHLFCCDVYDKLASTIFTVYEPKAPSLSPVGTLSQTSPNTFAFTGGTGSIYDWVGIYHAGDLPDPGAGGVPSMTYLYVGGVNGEVTFDAMPDSLIPGNYYDAHFFCCDGYDIVASYENWTVSLTDAKEAAELKSLFHASPNPAHEVLRLVFNQNMTGSVMVSNTLGQVICTREINNEDMLEFGGLNPGTYFVQYRGENGVQGLKVVME